MCVGSGSIAMILKLVAVVAQDVGKWFCSRVVWDFFYSARSLGKVLPVYEDKCVLLR